MLAVMGCGSSSEPVPPASSIAPPSASATSTESSTQASLPSAPTESVVADSKKESAAAQTATNAASGSNSAQTSAPGAVAEADAKAIQSPTSATSITEPATAFKALGLIDLEKLPRLNSKMVLEQGPTYVYYSAEGSLASVDAFYKAELAGRGWTETPSLVTGSDHYVDRMFTKDGFMIRAGLSSGSRPGEVGIMLANLGNVDVRQLPKMDDATANDAVAVNAGHQTSSGIVQVAETLGKKMLDLGWQICQDFHGTEISVPHYRSIVFRKNACRVTLGISKDPKQPSAKVMAFYLADHMIPFDVPTPDHRQPLKLDVSSGRSSFAADKSRESMVALLAKSSTGFGWKIPATGDFVSAKAHVLKIETGPKVGLAARLVEQGGKYSIWLERVALTAETEPTKQDVQNAEVAALPTAEPASKEKSEVEKQIEQVESEISKAVGAELNKALGSLNGLGAGNSVDIGQLQAQAEKLLNNLERDSSPTTAKARAVESPSDPFKVAEDTQPVSAEDQAIRTSSCTLQFGSNKFVLKHAVAYTKLDNGDATKFILFSDQPLNVDKLKRMLAKGESVHAMDVVANFSSPAIDIRITDSNVSINAMSDGTSLASNSGDIVSTVRFRGGKLHGRVRLVKPMKSGDELFTFAAEVNQPVLQIALLAVDSPERNKLVADGSAEYPIPENCESTSSEGTRYLKDVTATIDAPLAIVQAFYQSEATKRGWKEVKAQQPAPNKKVYFGPTGQFGVVLSSEGDRTSIKLSVRDDAAARADNVIPAAGKCLGLLGNMSTDAIEVTIGSTKYALKPEQGAGDPKTALRVAMSPGTYPVTWRNTKTGKSASTSLAITAGTTWGVIYDNDFQDVMRIY